MGRKTTTDAQVVELIQRTEEEIRKGIEGIKGLPGVWDVWLTTAGRLQIGMRERDGRIDRHCIEIYFGTILYPKEGVWDAQIGDRGAFDLTPGSDRLTFYIGAGLILGSDFMQELKQLLKGDFMGAYKEIMEIK